MQTKTETFDVKKAKIALENNLAFERGVAGTNRPIDWKTVQDYARDMLTGNWVHHHQGLGYDVNSKMVDGQHRMYALIMAAETGVPNGEEFIEPNPKIRVSFQVTYGLAPEVFDKLDTGRRRDGKQILAMSGFTNQQHLAASARLLFLYDNYHPRFWTRIRVTNHQILETVNATKIYNYLQPVMEITGIGLIAPAGATGYFICERAFPKGPHEEFIDCLKTGIGDSKEDPRVVFRNYLVRSKGKKGARRSSFNHLALYIKTWNDYVAGRRRTSIHWRSDMEFPQPVEK